MAARPTYASDRPPTLATATTTATPSTGLSGFALGKRRRSFGGVEEEKREHKTRLSPTETLPAAAGMAGMAGGAPASYTPEEKKIDEIDRIVNIVSTMSAADRSRLLLLLSTPAGSPVATVATTAGAGGRYYCAERITKPRCALLPPSGARLDELKSLGVQTWATEEECRNSGKCTRLLLPRDIQQNVADLQSREEKARIMESVVARKIAQFAGEDVKEEKKEGEEIDYTKILPSIYKEQAMILNYIKLLYHLNTQEAYDEIGTLLARGVGTAIEDELYTTVVNNIVRAQMFHIFDLELLKTLLDLDHDPTRKERDNFALLIELIRQFVPGIASTSVTWNMSRMEPIFKAALKLIFQLISKHTLGRPQTLGLFIQHYPYDEARADVDALSAKLFRIIFGRILEDEKEMLASEENQVELFNTIWPSARCVQGQGDWVDYPRLAGGPKDTLVKRFFFDKVVKDPVTRQRMRDLLTIVDRNETVHVHILHGDLEFALTYMQLHPGIDFSCAVRNTDTSFVYEEEKYPFLFELQRFIYSSPWFHFRPTDQDRLKYSLLQLSVEGTERDRERMRHLLSLDGLNYDVYTDIKNAIGSMLDECEEKKLDCVNLSLFDATLPMREPSRGARDPSLPLMGQAPFETPLDIPLEGEEI